MTLFAIGDSITQGFMSGAAARTDLAYPAIIARAMNMSVGSTASDAFRIPQWGAGGLPLNLELLARKLRKSIGGEIDVWDWPFAANVVRSYMDSVEDYYERGAGVDSAPFGQLPYFHNAAVQGFDVADAWLVTPDLCRAQIRQSEMTTTMSDGLFSYPSAAFYRTALNVLDPLRDPANAKKNVIDLLADRIADGGVDNLLLWLGSNNALGTVISLNVHTTNKVTLPQLRAMSRPERDVRFNLWAPDHFAAEYEELLQRVDAEMRKNTGDWRVFVGTVPAVSIAPLLGGVGEEVMMPDPFEVLGPAGERSAKYYQYYTYFLFDAAFAHSSDMKLTLSQVYQIDEFIAGYNAAIKAHCASLNAKYGQTRYVIVDTCKMLLEAAYKRNNRVPVYKWPQAVKNRYPMVDTRFHHATKGDTQIEQGGLFSMDGIHPSAIGQGIVAYEFLKMIDRERGTSHVSRIPWDQIYASDELYNHPIELMGSIRRKAPDLAKFLVWATSLKGRGPRGR